MTTYSTKPIKFSEGELMTIEEALNLLEIKYKQEIFAGKIEELQRFKLCRQEIS